MDLRGRETPEGIRIEYIACGRTWLRDEEPVLQHGYELKQPTEGVPMPQYGVLVYLPAPADPARLDTEYLEAIERYPEEAKRLGGKVLGGSYFPGQRGFAFEASTKAVSVEAGESRPGALTDSPLVPAAFFVLSAPDVDAAVQTARAHPAATTGGIEVRELYPEPKS